MVKRNNSNNKSRKNARPSRPNPARRTGASKPIQNAIGRLDASAVAHARMLLDPCNAALVGPTYSGMGTGEYRRYRRIINVPTSVEGTYVIQPSTNSIIMATHVASNAGTPYTFGRQRLFGVPELDIDYESRCLAACVKVRYIGSESARAGTIGLMTGPSDNGYPGQSITNSESLSRCNVINRLGEVQHEVKFTPGIGDEAFSQGASATVQDTARNCGTMTVVYTAVPDLTIQLEITAIMEVEAAKGSGIVATAVPPRSGNTLNQVIRSLGPSANWAFGHVVAPTIRAVAGMAMQTVSNAASASSASRLLLTL